MFWSEAVFVVSVSLLFANEAFTPAADALMREITELIESFALMAMLVPLMVNEPAVTCAFLSNCGRRFGSALLNVADVSIVGAVLLTPALPVALLTTVPAE